jgi:predicted nucleic acid-binding protein
LASEAVVNASPLIYLTGAGRLDLLRLSADEVVAPEAVAAEEKR